MRNLKLGGLLLYSVFFLFFAVSWVTNVIKLFNCDFEPSYKEEIIHAIGVVIAPLSMVTAWL